MRSADTSVMLIALLASLVIALATPARAADTPAGASAIEQLIIDADLQMARGQVTDAERGLKRAWAMLKAEPRPDHLVAATILDRLAVPLVMRHELPKADKVLRRSLVLWKALAADSPNLGERLSNLADLCCMQGGFVEAEGLYREAISQLKRTTGVKHRFMVQTLEGYANLLLATRRDAQATKLKAKIAAIQSRLDLDVPQAVD